MNPSFDENLREKLENYKHSPSPMQKKRVFDVLAAEKQSKSFILIGKYAAAILLITAIPFLLFDSKSDSKQSDDISVSENPSPNRVANQQAVANNSLTKGEGLKTRLHDDESVNVKISTANVDSNGIPTNSQNTFENVFVKENSDSKDVIAKANLFPSLSHKNNNIFKLNDISDFSKVTIDSIPTKDTTIIAQKKKRKNLKLALKPFLELGVFFLYQNIVPDIEDELIIDNFEGQNSISLSRLGSSASFGVSKDVSDKVNLSLGLLFSAYQQKFTFDVREITPSTGFYDASTNTLSSSFLSNEIDIHHTIFNTGLLLSSNFHVLPNQFDALYLGMEYNKVLNGRHSFTFNETDYQIGYPDQWLISFGLQKKLFDSKQGDFYFVPNVRYSIGNNTGKSSNSALSLKPFSVGLTINYSFL